MFSANNLPVANPTLTRALCKALVAGWEGISATEMHNAFAAAGITMIKDFVSKTDIAYHALMNEQQFAQSSGPLARFVSEALAPARFLKEPQKRQRIISDVDTILRTYKFSVTDEGHIVPALEGVIGADALTRRLKEKLVLRGTHAEALRFCEEELINQSMFHAVTEATKSLIERIRPAECALDGEKLTQYVFGTRNNPGPRFINDFSSPADEAEHFGFIHLLNGIYGHLRNDHAHRARLGSEEKEQDFLDAMAMISYAHRVIDRSWLKGQA